MLLSILQLGCSLFCTCGCGDEYPDSFTVEEAALTPVDNNYQLVETPTATISNLLFLFRYTNVTYADANEISSPLAAAYACSPADPRPTQSINQITITSNANYEGVNQIFAKGESLNNIFHVSTNYTTLPVSEFLKQADCKLPYGELIFILTEKPKNIQAHTFRFEVTLSDGRVLSGEVTLTLA
jgi:hypothetical protein